jgi:hypothetical protein
MMNEKWEVDEIGTGVCPMTELVINRIQISGSIIKELVINNDNLDSSGPRMYVSQMMRQLK